MSYIYKITNIINGKSYIGQTSRTIEDRWKEHLHNNHDIPLVRAFKKYGIENFKIECLEECSESMVNERECYWISYYDTYYNGYNATLGGDGRVQYNYEAILNKYFELKNTEAVAKYFGCSIDTVRAIRKKFHTGNLYHNDPDLNKNLRKKVIMIDKDTNEPIKIFPSMRAASMYLIGSTDGNGHIGAVCKWKRKTAYGYKWKLYENNFNQLDNIPL